MSRKEGRDNEGHTPKKSGKWLFIQNMPRKLKNMKYKRAFFFSLKQGTLNFSNQMINLYKLQSEF